MNKPKKNKLISGFHILVMALILGLWFTMAFAAEMHVFSTRNENDQVTMVKNVTISCGSSREKAVLPLVLDNLPHSSKVEVSFTIPAAYGARLFFGSVYAPLKIYMDGQQVYVYGDLDSFPSFFIDPPTCYTTIPLPERHGVNEKLRVKMVYTSPLERDTLSIHAPFYGNDAAIVSYLMKTHGLSFLAAVFFLFIGFLLIIISLMFLYTPKAVAGVFLPGLMIISAGAWQFGENTLSVYLLEKPSLMYIIDFAGLFVLVIPMYMMAMLYLEMFDSRLLRIILYLLEGSALLAFVLQLMGLVAFHRSLYWFHLLLPSAILILTLRILYQLLTRREKNAALFFLSFLIMLVAVLIELVNYYAHLHLQISSPFQIGLFFFMLMMAVISGLYIRNLTSLQLNNMKLENENRLKEQAIEAQKSKNTALLSHYEEIRKQRHDIRHHLRTIDNMVRKEGNREISEYIHSIEDSIPAYISETICDNPVVNSTISYYRQMAEDAGIRLNLNVQVPRNNRSISDASLCVIFGNLLENAIEACRRMIDGNPFIILQTRVAGEMLFVSMENSYDGTLRLENGQSLPEDFDVADTGLLSSKHDGVGTGLQSVSSICRSHQGSASFTVKKNCFRSEICIRL